MKKTFKYSIGLMFLLSASVIVAQNAALYDDFEGNGIVSWNYYEDTGKPGKVEFGVSNPSPSGINTSATVGKFTKTSTSNAWMNAYIDVPNGFDLSEVSQFTILVYSASTHQVKLKLQPGDDYTKAVERTANISLANTWLELSFDFSSVASRTDLTKLNIHFNDGTAANGVYYFDLLYGPPLKPSITLSDDGEIKRLHEDGEIISVGLFFDSFVETLNPSNWTFENLPAGVSVSAINRISDKKAELVLSGNASENYSKSIRNFTVRISHEELVALTEGNLTAETGVLFDASYWKLIWNDEFDNAGLPDNTKWSFEAMVPGTVNNELQNYVVNRTENARVEGGNLIIECRKDNYNGYPYSSARLRTLEKGDWLYGRIVTRAKLPAGKGTWPAIWMLPSDWEYGGWPTSGEIDIMEHVGYDPGNVHASFHTDSYNHTKNTQKTSTYFVDDFNTAFHEYTVDWKPEFIDAYIDSNNYYTFSNEHNTYKEWPFDKRFYLILNIAYGGSWGGAQGIDDAIFNNPDGIKMTVDFVRVYKNIEDLIISGPDAVFENEKNIHFSVDQIEGVEYHWLSSDSYSIITSADSGVVSVDWGCNADTISIELLVDGTAYYTLSKVVEIKPFAIDGDNWVNENATGILYTTQAVEGAVYTWSGSDGIEIASGQGTDSVLVNFSKEGSIYLQIETACGVQYDTFAVKFGDGQFPYPEGHAPYPVPGKLVAANFDLGGEGVAYHDSDAGNNGGELRPTDDVDIENKDASYTIGWSATGEWLEYTVNVAYNISYDLSIRAGGQNGGKIRILQDGMLVSDTIALPATGSWDIFKTVNVSGITLSQGKSVIRIEFVLGGCNLGDITFSEASGIAENPAEDKTIAVFPNPAYDRLSIRINNAGDSGELFQAQVHNLQGSTLLSSNIMLSNEDAAELNISSLPNGIYLLSVEGKTHKFNQKFIRQ